MKYILPFVKYSESSEFYARFLLKIIQIATIITIIAVSIRFIKNFSIKDDDNQIYNALIFLLVANIVAYLGWRFSKILISLKNYGDGLAKPSVKTRK